MTQDTAHSDPSGPTLDSRRVVVRVEDVTRDFRVGDETVRALRGITLEVLAGEYLSIMGPSGSGKSTLFNTISGLLKPTAGKISLNGKDVTGLKPSGLVQSGVVQCPEGRKLFPEMSVMKNLMLGAYPERARASRQENLEKVVALFPKLAQRRNQTARTMSGGYVARKAGRAGPSVA